MKKSLLIINFGLFISIPQISFAEVFHLAKICQDEKIVIENLSANKLTFWLQTWNTSLVDETGYTVEPYQTADFSLKNDLANTEQHYSILNLNSKIQASKDFKITSKCLDNQPSQLPEINSQQGGMLTFNISFLAKKQLEVANLSALKNDIYVFEYDLNHNLVTTQTFNLSSREHKFINLETDAKTNSIQVFGSQNTKIFMKNKNSYVTPTHITVQKSVPENNAVYFLIAPRQVQNIETSKDDQFIVKITNPKLIEKARDQIKNKNLEKIIFGQVVLGHQGFNRNLGSKNKNFWNWSVSVVTNIADLGSTTCNGFPQLIEDRSEFWINNPGNICFWNYRIKKELTADEIGF